MLAGIIDAAVDVNGVARFCLGRYWRTATPAQQQQYIKLFRDMLVTNISAKLGEYQGATFSVGATQGRDVGEPSTASSAGRRRRVWHGPLR